MTDNKDKKVLNVPALRLFRLCDSRSSVESGKGTNYQRFVHSIQEVLLLLQKRNSTMEIFHLYVLENYIRTKQNCS